MVNHKVINVIDTLLAPAPAAFGPSLSGEPQRPGTELPTREWKASLQRTKRKSTKSTRGKTTRSAETIHVTRSQLGQYGSGTLLLHRPWAAEGSLTLQEKHSKRQRTAESSDEDGKETASTLAQ